MTGGDSGFVFKDDMSRKNNYLFSKLILVLDHLLFFLLVLMEFE